MQSNQKHQQIIAEAVALRPKIRRFAFGLTGVMDDAEELVQAAYERVLTSLDRWEYGSRLDSWIYRIVQNLWLNQLRSEKTRNRFYDDQDADLVSCDRSQRSVEAGMTLDKVQQAMMQLPDEQRVAVLLVTVEGLPYREAAEVLGISESALTSRLFRGRQYLIDALAGDGGSSL